MRWSFSRRERARVKPSWKENMSTQSVASGAAHRRRFSAFWIMLLVLVLALAGWGIYAVSSGDKQELVTAVVTRGDIERTVSATGNIQPREFVDVGAQVSGQLNKLLVDVGDEVKKGQLLAEIEAAVQLARVDAARAQLEAQQAQLQVQQAQLKLAELQFQRQQNLRKAKATSEGEYQIAEASVASAKAQIKGLEAQIRQTSSSLKEDEATLSYTRIFAPMDGVVVSLNIREGTTLNANQTAPILMRIADLSTVTVQAQVSEADVSRLKIGMPVRFSPIGETRQKWSSSLRQILPTPEVLNNVVLYTALFDVENPNGRLMTDMTAQVFFIEAEARDALLVPVAALQRGADRRSASVKVLIKGKPQLREVEVGLSDRIHAQIQQGLEEGEELVVDGAKSPVAGGGRRPMTPRLF